MQNTFTPASSDEPRYRSGAVARMVRIPVATLRIWERRYQVVGPTLTPTGHRLYSGADVERLLLIKQLVDQGHAIGSLARLAMPALLQIADTRAALAQPPAAALARSRAALIGLGLPRRLGALPLQRVATWADLASAERALAEPPADAGAALRAELLVAELPTLQPETVNRLLALMRQLGTEQAVVLYGFGPEVVAQRLRRAGCTLLRTPLDDGTLRGVVADLCATTAGVPRPLAQPAAADAAAVPAGAAVPPRRFDDAALVQLASASGTMSCECPRHVAELVMLLAHFEAYSAECVHRGPDDAALHTHLHRVAGTARLLFEEALVRVAEAEGLPLPPAPGAPADPHPGALPA